MYTKTLYFVDLAAILDAIFNFYDSVMHLFQCLIDQTNMHGNRKDFNIWRQLGRHLEFLKLLKDDKVSSIGFLK